MESIISRGINVSEYFIGYFYDKRLMKTGALFFKQLIDFMNSTIKVLSPNRATEVAFNRFLQNTNVTTDEIIDTAIKKTCLNSKKSTHILCIQDMLEVNYPEQDEKKCNFGINRKTTKTHGFLSQVGLAVDAQNLDVLGLCGIKTWCRNELTGDRKKRVIEDKESYKWIDVAKQSVKTFKGNDKILTIIGDRESDIYELFDRVPSENVHLLVRSLHDRTLQNGSSLVSYLLSLPIAGTYRTKLSRISGVRKEREAIIEVKYSTIEICEPKHSCSVNSQQKIQLTCVEAKEINCDNTVAPIFWRLLTTHAVNSLDDAKQIIYWYQCRWQIEQLFRILQKKGFQIESSQIEDPSSIFKLFLLLAVAASEVLCLVNARDGNVCRPAEDIFTKEEIIFLAALLKKYEGKTAKQKNPFKHGSLSWASWIISRMGGWNGYANEYPPGPNTVFRGLQKFKNSFEGWQLALELKDVCIG